MKRLNFGCGSVQPEGWINLDKDGSFNAAHSHTEVFPDNYFDIIVAHAVIQQFEWHEMVDNLKKLYRVLKPGGILRISLPDIIKGFEAYQKDDISFFPNGEENIDLRLSAWITWYSTSKTLLTVPALGFKLMEAGFEYDQVRFKQTKSKYSEIIELDTRENEFFFMEARK